MIKRNDIYSQTDIRSTIEKWYDGASTPAEENLLVEYFASTDDADIPADIIVEAPVFRAIGTRRISPDKALFTEVNAAIVAENFSKSRVGRMVRITGWLTAAAVASVAVVLVIGFLNQTPISLNEPSFDNTIAVKSMIKADTLITHPNDPIVNDITAVQPEALTKSVPKTNREIVKTAKTENSDIIFIDDVDKATEIIAMVNTKLEKFGNVTSDAVKRTFEKTPDINRELEKVPDYKTIIRDVCSNITLPTI